MNSAQQTHTTASLIELGKHLTAYAPSFAAHDFAARPFTDAEAEDICAALPVDKRAVLAKIGDGSIAKGLSNLLGLLIQYGPTLISTFGPLIGLPKLPLPAAPPATP